MFSMSVLDFVHWGSSLLLRSFGRLGSAVSVSRMARFGSGVSVLDFVNLGSTQLRRSFSWLGSSMSVLDFLHLGSALPLRVFARAGSSVFVHGLARYGLMFSMSVLDFVYLAARYLCAASDGWVMLLR